MLSHHQRRKLSGYVKGDMSNVKAPKIRAIEVRAEVRQIRTMADGTVNVILNLPEDCREQAKVLLDWLGLEVKAVIVEETV